MSNSAKCRHCGGLVVDRIEEHLCVQCGRERAHRCDMCLYPETDAAAEQRGNGPGARSAA